ncbi:galactose-1-phosphate uridylyltransferase [Candidatus Rhodoluna planktonica]|nr:galactose-1-phosphate uridylyltransferase [Candidatus Rhodoluna planktonica]
MTGIKKISAKLADGRDLLFFDDVDSKLPATRLADTRELPERPPVAQMRLDSLTGDWISVAAHRHGRAFLPPANQCPLCPTTTTNQSEMPDFFDVAVFENKSPSFGPTLPEVDDENYAVVADLKLGSTRDSIGRCEVVVFSPEHLGSLGQMAVSRVRTVIEAWADRTTTLQALPGIRQVFPFENRGQEIGVTLHHPHGQIYAYPYVTPRTKKLLSSIAAFGDDLFEQTLQFEKSSERVLIAGEHFTAYVPFAARWPIEIHLLPHRHVNHFGQLTEAEKDELASIYSKLLKALDLIYDTPTPYIAAWHQAPLVAGGEKVRLQLQITSPRRAEDKLKYLAGSESAMGAFIADFPPEVAAELLRGAIR